MTGVVVLGVAVLASVLVAVVTRRRNGRFGGVATESREAVTSLDAETLGAPLGRDVTLVQFSSSFCAPCRATRVLLADVVASLEGVETIEIDAESHLELVRELSIMRTPTVLVLDERGVVRTRASGLPRREQVVAAIEAARSPSDIRD